MYDTHGCVAEHQTFCMISLSSVDCQEVGIYGRVSVGRVIGLGEVVVVEDCQEVGCG